MTSARSSRVIPTTFLILQFLIMENKIIIEFKEVYMPHSVRRTCYNMTKEQIIEIYDLINSDIEWYKFIEE